MQKIIQRIYNEALSDEDKLTASLMEDQGEDYYVFAWNTNGKILRLGYGKEHSYLSYKPEMVPETPEDVENHKIDISFPFSHLTEKEAYVLFRYTKKKMKLLGYSMISEIGLNDIYY